MLIPTTLGRAVAAVLFTALLPAGVRAEECLPDWGEAGQIVRSQKLLTVQQLIDSSSRALRGQIVKTTLCKDGDDYIYKVVVRQSNGQLRTVVVDAKMPISGTIEGSLGR